MKSAWPLVKLGEVLATVERPEQVDPTKEYRLLGVRLDGAGAFLRETILGTQIAASKLSRVSEGDFIYSRLFACRGAFGTISRELDGCYVSGEFPTFVPVDGKVDIKFIKYWFRLSSVIERVNQDCTGSTPLTRNRFKENFFLALEIPLPSLAEQQRLVARIERFVSQIKDARALREQADKDSDDLLIAMAHRGDLDADAKGARSWRRVRLSEVIREVDDAHRVDASKSYPNIGIYSFGRGLFRKPPIDGMETSAKTLRRIKAGQFI